MKHITSKLLSLLLCLAMLMSMVPVAYATNTESTDVDDVSTSENSVALSGDETEMPVSGNAVSTNEELATAIANAADGDTIMLGEGEFTTYGNASPEKSLTFIGSGTGTVWTIGDLKKNVGGEGNGDYSFDGCDTITFKNMTLKSDGFDYRGFIRINNTVVENCTLDGKTAYWGYTTATFKGCTFNAPKVDYALWDYSTPSMTFDGCTFNISGKGVNVYVETNNAGSATRTVTVKDCAVNSVKENKAFLNIKNSTQSYDVTFSGTNAVNGLAADSTTASNLYQVETTEVTEKSGKPVTVKQEANGTLTTVYEVKAPAQSTYVAKVGETSYATLAEAFAALGVTNHTLTLIDNSAWDAATPVYWAAGTKSGYVAKLTDALTEAYKQSADAITIVCRPGADVGTMTHGHVADNLTIYGNKAYVSGGECDLEVDTYQFSRETGAQVKENGVYLDKDITITAYELDNLGVWGQRNTNHTVTVNLTDCDGKAIEGKKNVQRVYISGTSGVNNITVTDCDFLTAATAVYSNADGAVVIDNCSFTGGQVPVNFNHKANGTQTVTVKNSAFTNCGDEGDWKQFAAPVRFVNSGKGTSTTAVENCTFSGTVGSNGDILIGDGRTNEKSNDVSLKVTNTSANVQAQKPGYYNGDTTDASKKGEKKVEKSGMPFTTSVTELTTSTELTDYVMVGGIKGFEDKKFASFADAYAEIKPELKKLCKEDALGQGVATAEAFDALFTDRDTNGNATLTYTITGNVTYDETSLDYLLTMGRKASHYGNDRHLINFEFVGGSGNRDDTLTVNSNITLPYEWWGEKTTTSISFENLTITGGSGSADSGLFATQAYFERIDFKVSDCTLRGIKIYNCSNVGGSYTITNSTLDGTGAAANAYAIHLQGNETAPLTINISGNTISGYDRGINIDQKTANATISGNTISIKDADRSCIQLTQLAKLEISQNNLNLTGGNAFTLHNQLAAGSDITISGNTITGEGYLIYDNTKNPIKLTYSENTLTPTEGQTIDTTQGIYKNATKKLSDAVNTVVNSSSDRKGSETNPYTLAELGAMTRDAYIAAQTRLGGTMYVDVGNYSYDANGTLGNGVRNDATGQTEDRSVLNGYNSNGYLGEKNDGANGKNIVFVGGKITSGVTGYTSIDNIGTYLLLAVPAYTNVTFKGTTFNNVMSFNYQLYTGPWSQLGELKFDGCTFNGIIVGAIAAQTLTFNKCTFTNYENTNPDGGANNSNPIWVRPAYGNWTKGDNEGQGGNFKSLTTINFTGNTVTSTRPVKFERIAQWEMPTTVTATGNSFDIKAQTGDTSTKNVGLYFGANAKFDLVAASNTKSDDTAALYTAVYSAPNGVSYPGLPAGSTVKNSQGNEAKLDALKWKATNTAKDTLTLTTTKEVASMTNTKGTVNFATLQEAIDAAARNATVKLLADVIQNTMLTIDKNITLDLNGKKIYNTEDIWSDSKQTYELISVEAKVTITGNGSIEAKENDCYTINVKNGNLTIENGTFVGNISVVQVEKGTLTINGGEFKLLQKWEGTSKYLINCIDKSYADKTAVVDIRGGTFVDFDPNVAPEKKVDGKAPSFVISAGIGVTKDADGNFTAVPNMAAQIVDADGNSVAAYAGHYDAIAAAKNGETVILLSDCKNFATNTINANITIDLNGKPLSVGNNNPFFRTNGEVTIQNGTITSDFACVIVNAYNKLTLKNVKITGVTDDNGKNLVNVCSNAEVTIDKDTVLTASGSGVAVFIGQDADAQYTLNVYGKVIQNSKTYAICGNGSYKGTSTINIYDGAEVKSPTCVAIYQPQAGVTNIYGGLVEGKCAIGIKSGALNISGGTVRGTANDNVLSDNNSNGNGISYDGSAIIVDSRATGYAGNVKINVTGGTVESYYSNAIREIGNDPSVTQLTELTVTGGNVFGASSKTENVTNDMLVRDISVKNVSVSGGTFKHEVQSEYCAIGFEPTRNTDGTYGVRAAEGNAYYTKEDGKVVYGDLSALLTDSATEGKTITLLTNVTSAKSIALWDDRTIDLAGLVLEFTGNAKFMTMDGWIKDSTNGNGLLKIAQTYGEGKQTTAIQSSNEQLPIYDSAKGGYRLFDCKMVSMKQAKGDGVVIWLCPQFKNLEAYKLLKSGNAHNTAVSVIVSWNTTSGEKVSRSFEFTQAMMDTVVNNYNFEANRPGQLFILTLTGLGSDLTGVITHVAAQPCMGSKTGALKVGEMISLAN